MTRILTKLLSLLVIFSGALGVSVALAQAHSATFCQIAPGSYVGKQSSVVESDMAFQGVSISDLHYLSNGQVTGVLYMALPSHKHHTVAHRFVANCAVNRIHFNQSLNFSSSGVAFQPLIFKMPNGKILFTGKLLPQGVVKPVSITLSKIP